MPAAIRLCYDNVMGIVSTSVKPLKCLLPATLCDANAGSEGYYRVVVSSLAAGSKTDANTFHVSSCGGEQQAYSQALKWGVDAAHERFCLNEYNSTSASLAFFPSSEGGGNFVGEIVDYRVEKLVAVITDKSGRKLNSREFYTAWNPHRSASSWIREHLKTAENAVNGKPEGTIVCQFKSGETRNLPLGF